MSDLIDRQAAIDALEKSRFPGAPYIDTGIHIALREIKALPSVQPEQQWIPCSERLLEEDHWLGGSGRQFSDNVLVSILNSNDEDAWVDISQTIDGEWTLELPRYCQIIAWMPLPGPYKGEGE